MLTQKPCKWCGSIWHSKNKCPKRENQPLPEGFLQKRSYVPLSSQNASQSLRTRHSTTSERSALIREADRVHSAYIRGLSEYCYTCNRKVEGLQNGHFMSRRFIKTRWNNINCHPQCNECNVEKGGNLKVYEQKLRQQYGDDNIDALKHFARSGGKVTNVEIQLVIDKYRLVF